MALLTDCKDRSQLRHLTDMFSKKATKINKIFTVDWSVKSTVKILSIFVAFLEKMNFNRHETI